MNLVVKIVVTRRTERPGECRRAAGLENNPPFDSPPSGARSVVQAGRSSDSVVSVITDPPTLQASRNCFQCRSGFRPTSPLRGSPGVAFFGKHHRVPYSHAFRRDPLEFLSRAKVRTGSRSVNDPPTMFSFQREKRRICAKKTYGQSSQRLAPLFAARPLDKHDLPEKQPQNAAAHSGRPIHNIPLSKRRRFRRGTCRSPECFPC